MRRDCAVLESCIDRALAVELALPGRGNAARDLGTGFCRGFETLQEHIVVNRWYLNLQVHTVAQWSRNPPLVASRLLDRTTRTGPCRIQCITAFAGIHRTDQLKVGRVTGASRGP